ncbi:MAG: MBL fold metallo-hydrolase [Pseudanabaena sp. ELA607]|jgi:L-ascorbate metabolism protein UlaG (beta-lactamase superfamily)
MRRRQFLQFAQGGLLASMATTAVISPGYSQSQSGNSNELLTLQWFGHLSFLVTGSNTRILTHPFRAGGCTAGLKIPKLDKLDYLLISSQLFDEGYLQEYPTVPVLAQPGSYRVKNLSLQGIRMDHDRQGGRRFGQNVAWRWQQAGVSILHLGGAAATIQPDQRILMGRPDVLILPVGGDAKSDNSMLAKAYGPEEAAAVAKELNPRIVVPVYYRMPKAAATCALNSIDAFVKLMPANSIQQLNGNILQLSAGNLPEQTVIRLLKV